MPVKMMTKAWVESVATENGTRIDYHDSKTSGLMLRVSPPSAKNKDGVKTWAMTYRRTSDGKKRCYTIGRFSEYGNTLAKARQIAKELMAEIGNGADPAGDKQDQKKADTLKELALEWIQRHAKKNKRTWKEDLRYLEHDVFPVLGDMKAHEIKRKDIRRLFEAKTEGDEKKKIKPAPIAANRMLAVLSVVFNWAISTDRLEGAEFNPADRIPKNREDPRKRYLETETEIKAFWVSIESSGMCHGAIDIIKIALLTGQRSGEPRQAKKTDIDLEKKTWIIRADIAKTKNDHILPLAPEAYRIFSEAIERSGNSEYVFPSPVTGKPMVKSMVSKAWARIRGSVGLEDVNIHDMRRTLRTGLGELEISSDLHDRITNHGRKRNQSTGDLVYDFGKYGPQMRRALEAWENHVMSIIKKQKTYPDNVTPMRKA